MSQTTTMESVESVEPVETTVTETEKSVLKLFKGVTIPKDDPDAKKAMKYFYKAKASSTDKFMDVIGRIKQLTHTISDLNLPLLLNPYITKDQWTPKKYEEEMISSVNDVVESIKTDILYGKVESFAKMYQLSGDWLLHGIYTGEEVDEYVPDDDVITLGKLTGDVESRINRIKNGSVEYLSHQHKPVHLPSLDMVNEELGDMAEEADLEYHIEELAQFKAENGDQSPVLPDAPNPLGLKIDPDGSIRPTIRRNGQPLPKSKLAKALEECSFLNKYTLEELITAVSKRLPSGTSITITG